jgi:hypothetical protein
MIVVDVAVIGGIIPGGVNMKRRLPWPVLVFFMIVCTPSQRDYYPLSLSYTWYYQYTEIRYGMYQEVDTVVGTAQISIVSDTILEGMSAYKQVTERSTDTTVYDTVFIVELDSVVLKFWTLPWDTLHTLYHDTLLKLPLEIGKSWIVHQYYWVTEQAEVVSKESATVPGGQYTDCWKVGIAMIDLGVDRHLYYAPNIGMVKSHDLWDTEEIFELESASLE